MSSKKKLNKKRAILKKKRATLKKRKEKIKERNKKIKERMKKESEKYERKRDEENKEFQDDAIDLLQSIEPMKKQEEEEQIRITKTIKKTLQNKVNTSKRRNKNNKRRNKGLLGAKIVGKIRFRGRGRRTRKKRGAGTVQSRKKRRKPEVLNKASEIANTAARVPLPQARQRPIQKFTIKRQLSDIDEQRDPEGNIGIDYASLRPPQSLSSKPKSRTEKRTRALSRDNWKDDVQKGMISSFEGKCPQTRKSYKFLIPHSILKDEVFIEELKEGAYYMGFEKILFVYPDFSQHVFQTYLLRELLKKYVYLMQKTPENLYEILGVSNGDSANSIKKAYRKLILKYHPDKSKHPNAANLFRRIRGAYKILSNPSEKSIYDSEIKKSRKYWGYIMDVINMDEILLPAGKMSQYSLKYYSITSPFPRSIPAFDDFHDFNINRGISPGQQRFFWNSKTIFDFLIHMRKIIYNPANTKVNPIIDPLIRLLIKRTQSWYVLSFRYKYPDVFDIIDDVDTKPSAPPAHLMRKAPSNLKLHTTTRKKGGRRKTRKKKGRGKWDDISVEQMKDLIEEYKKDSIKTINTYSNDKIQQNNLQTLFDMYIDSVSLVENPDRELYIKMLETLHSFSSKRQAINNNREVSGIILKALQDNRLFNQFNEEGQKLLLEKFEEYKVGGKRRKTKKRKKRRK